MDDSPGTSPPDRPLNIIIANSGRNWIGEVAHCIMLYETLRARGHSVWLACRSGSQLDLRAHKDNLDFLSLRFISQFKPSRDTLDVLALRDLIRREKINLIHVHRGKDHWTGLAAAMLTGIPIVRTRHVVTPVKQHLPNQWLYRRATDAVISVSRAAQASFGYLQDEIRHHYLILSAVDGARFNPAMRSSSWRAANEGTPDDGEPLWIGLIGRFQGIKGQEFFLRAAGIIAAKFPRARFLMAGRGEEERIAPLRNLARELGLENRLTIAGELPNLPEVMASLDLGVVASVGSEGSSRVVLEYMASGVPVVATHVGGIPDLLRPQPRPGEEQEVLGELVNPRDPEAIAQAVIKLIEDPALRRERAAAGRRAAQERHDPARWAQAVEKVYMEVLERRNSR